MIKFKTLRHALMMTAATLGGTMAATVADRPAFAQEVARTYAIPAQDLDDALRAFAMQTGRDVLYPPQVVAGKRSPGVQGSRTERQALAALLAGTGLRFEQTASNGYVVQDPASPTRAGEPAVLDEVVVTGTRLRGAGNSALPVETYSRADIEASGQPSVATFLSTLSEVSTSIPDSGFSGGSTIRQSGIQLRGLPAGTTLVLLNGRRVEPGSISTSGSVVDLNSIPVAAVERIEVLPIGSSAVYGGDALAGVVNIILKERMDGVAADVRYGFADGTDDTLVSFAGGRTFGRGSVLLLAQWNEVNPLINTERDFFLSGDYRPYGGPDTRTRLCSPGTVTAVSGNLPGLNSSFAAIPLTPSGDRPTLAQFAATAGQENLCDPNTTGGGYALIPDRESYAVHATGTFALSSRVKAFAEVTYDHADVFSRSRGLPLNNILVPATNAFNPFGAAVRVTTRLSPDALTVGYYRENEFTRAVVGLRGKITDSWDFDVSAMRSTDVTDSRGLGQTVIAAARTAALASSDPALALNPFTSGRPASDAVLASIFTDTRANASGARTLVSGLLRGTPLTLPAGPLQVAIGAERLSESLEYYSSSAPLIQERSSASAFAEARIPLLAATDETGGLFDRLALTVAGRVDDYSDNGSATTHQAGLEFRPVSDVLFRAVLATSFKPPALLQTGLPRETYDSALFGLRDPLRGGAPVIGGLVAIGANPDLVPETGESSVFGVEWTPRDIQGLRLSINAWRIDLENYIIRLAPQTIVDNEALFPGLVVRGPSVGGSPGPILEATSTYVNYGRLDVAGRDYDVSYDWPTALGQARVALSASQMTRFDVVIVPGAPTKSQLGRQDPDAWAPEWKGSLSLSLANPDWSFGLSGRYLGPYEHSGVAGGTAGDVWTLDASASVALGRFLPWAFTDQAKLSFNVVNLTDVYPEFVNSFPYYDVTQGSWRGRYASVRLSLNW